MKLLCITDIHGRPDRLAKIIAAAGPVDAVLLGGDLTHFGSPDQAAQLVGQTQSACPRVFAVAGNCDSRGIDQRLEAMDVSLFGHGAALNGFAFYGVSAMPPWRGTMYELSEDEIATALVAGRQDALKRLMNEAVRGEIILAHPPPLDTQLDHTRDGKHVGSAALRDFIATMQPTLVVCGHIHEARGIELLGATTIVNCGPAREGFYAVAEVDETVEVALEQAR